MATITFSTNGQTINHAANTGLGFFGSAGFGAAVSLSEYNSNTYITNSAGTTQGPAGNNVKYVNAQSGIVGAATSGINILAIPNYQSTLRINFNHSTAVKTQSAKLYIYDRTSINNPASGLTCKVAEIIHPSLVQEGGGSGDTTWISASATGTPVDFVSSPGVSGFRQSGSTTTQENHDWYACISATPDSIGSKTQFGLLFELEYY